VAKVRSSAAGADLAVGWWGAQAPLLPLNLWSPFKNFCNDGFEEERLEVEDVEYEDKLATSASLASDVCNH
jgi:hypothetical protein